MQDAVFVSVGNGARHLGDEFHRLPDRNRRVFNYFVELAAFDKLHTEIALAIALAYFVDGHDAGMVEARGSFGFKSEALEVCFSSPLAETDDL